MVTVVCVFWGNKFSKDYVYNLKSAVERNTTVTHKFVCLSDRVLPGIDTLILKKGYDGWWNKLQMFDGRLQGQIVYLDLDTLIVGNIDWLLNHRGNFSGIEDLGSINKSQPHLKGKLQSAILSFHSAQVVGWWIAFSFNFKQISGVYRGDGEYLESITNKNNRTLLQDEYPNQIKSYKYQVYPDKFQDTSIICFHGRPSIIQATEEYIVTPRITYHSQEWVKNYWR